MPRRSLHRLRPVASVVTLTILVTAGAACSSSSGGAAAAKPAGSTVAGGPTTTGTKVAGTGAVSSPGDGPNPCTVVTPAEVTAILGATASPAGPTRANRGADCKWNLPTGASLLVQVYQGKEFYNPSVQAPTAKKLAGVGDDAYLDAFGTTRADVGFLKGNVAVFVDGFEVASADAVVGAARDAASKV